MMDAPRVRRILLTLVVGLALTVPGCNDPNRELREEAQLRFQNKLSVHSARHAATDPGRSPWSKETQARHDRQLKQTLKEFDRQLDRDLKRWNEGEPARRAWLHDAAAGRPDSPKNNGMDLRPH